MKMTKDAGSLLWNRTFLMAADALRFGMVLKMASELLGGNISFVEGFVVDVVKVCCESVVVKGA